MPHAGVQYRIPGYVPGPYRHAPLLGEHTDQVLGEELLKAAQRMLVGMDGFTVETLLLMGDPAQEIVRAAEAKDANLIVIGSRGLSDLKGLWMGSVSHKVSNLSHINVVTCR